MSRPLSLHVSALSNAEFATYTSSIHDIVECPRIPGPDYDKLTVGVREARAWLRGRYPTLAPSTLDSILRLFSPDLGAADAMTGGQFFAALRLVSHVRSGKEMDPRLVFMQAYPDQSTSRPSSPVGKHSRVPSPDSNPFTTNGPGTPHTTSPATSAPVKPPPPSLPPKPTNPFRRASQDVTPQSAPPGTSIFPGPRSSSSQDSKLPPLPPRKPPVLPPPRHASMSKQIKGRDPPPPLPNAQPSRSAPSSNTNSLIQQSLQATRIAQFEKKADEALKQERILEVLKSSASRPRSNSPAKESYSSASSTSSSNAGASHSLHVRAPSLPPRPRNLSPPASTVGGSVRSFEQVATASLSPFKRSPLPTSTNGLPPPPEPPQRRITSPNQSPSRSPPSSFGDLPPVPSNPPPTHPDRKMTSINVDVDRVMPSNASPRVGRSRSLHHPTPPPVPPPPRRKRPESAQLTPTSSPLESPFANPSEPGSPTPSTLMLSRHLSLSSARERAREKEKEEEERERREKRDRERDRERRGRERDAFSDSPIGSIQKTLTSLQLRAQPALDVARYKAEGALSRRGFVQHGPHGPRWMRGEGEVRLMDDVDDVTDVGSPGPDLDDADSGLGHDWDGAGGESERMRRWRKGGVDVAVVGGEGGKGGRMVLERDGMKWPAGEGWAPL